MKIVNGRLTLLIYLIVGNVLGKISCDKLKQKLMDIEQILLVRI